MNRYYKLFIVISIFTSLFLSCTSTTNIKKRNPDGSPIWTTREPQSNDVIYGVGHSKLSNDKNSKTASEVKARNDISSKIKQIINEESTPNSPKGNTTYTDNRELLQIVLNNITIEEQWKGTDGTWWTLLSVQK